MTSLDNTSQPGLWDRFRKARRRFIKQTGKRLLRRLALILSAQSKIADTPVLENHHFPFLQPFTDNWQQIRDEVAEILMHRELVPAFQDVSPDQKRISKGDNWRVFVLFGFGAKLDRNCKQAPVTAKLLEQVPNLQTAWFSILQPGYHIPAHRGVSKGILRAHLGLLIPKDAEKCRIRVDTEFRVWRTGEIFVFDDTYEHEVWNDTDEERVVLLFDFDRPMGLLGRVLNNLSVWVLKMTAYYQEPKKNMMTFEDRFEAATRRADANLEKLSEPDQ